MNPTAASHYLNTLAERWNEDGPEKVFAVLENWTEEDLRYFAMMNIGARAMLQSVASKQN